MLKKYADDGQIRWVGKAWEIRRALRQELRDAGAQTRLRDWLAPMQAAAIGPHK